MLNNTKLLNYTYLFNIISFSIITITIIIYINVKNNINNTQKTSLELSSFITFIALIYYIFLFNNNNLKTNYIYRYLDWFLTTPLLLIDLMLLMNFNQLSNYYNLIIEIIAYNIVMLTLGLLGEMNIINMYLSMILGFIPFIYLFYRIIDTLNTNKDSILAEKKEDKIINSNNEKYTLLIIFIIIWSLYGLVHIIKNPYHKNIYYNTLDFIAKGLFALYILFKVIKLNV